MYKRFVRKKGRWIFERFNEGDYEALLAMEAPNVTLMHPGTHALGSELSNVEAVRLWYERFFRLFPRARFTVQDVVAQGGPWLTTVAVEWTLRAPVQDDLVLEDEGMHVLRIRWGRAVSISVYHNTQQIAETLQRMGELGIAEAHAPGVTDDDAVTDGSMR